MMVVLVMIPMIFASCFLFFSKMFQNDDHPNPKLLAVPGSNMIEINPAVCSTATPAVPKVLRSKLILVCSASRGACQGCIEHDVTKTCGLWVVGGVAATPPH